jgi:hypothetical protein
MRTVVGKDISAKLGMRVEMSETALAKARGGGVVTSVSRKGGHVSVKWDNGTSEDCVFTGDEGAYLLILSASGGGGGRGGDEGEGREEGVGGAFVPLDKEVSPRTILCRNPKALITSLRAQHAAVDGKGVGCPNSTVGVILDKTKVAFIVPGSAASKPREGTPLNPGDEIVMVDGERTSDSNIVKLLRGADIVGTSLRVVARRGGRERGGEGEVVEAVLMREDLHKVTEAKDLFLAMAELKAASQRRDWEREAAQRLVDKVERQFYRLDLVRDSTEVLCAHVHTFTNTNTHLNTHTHTPINTHTHRCDFARMWPRQRRHCTCTSLLHWLFSKRPNMTPFRCARGPLVTKQRWRVWRRSC